MAAHEIFAYLCVRDAAAAIRFYVEAFGAAESFRLAEPSGRIGHAEVEIDGHTLMLSDPYPESGVRCPEAGEAVPARIHLHVDDCDAWVERAVAAGATLVMPPTDQFYGERSARIRDPFDYEWLLGHTIEKVSHEEMQRRFTQMFE